MKFASSTESLGDGAYVVALAGEVDLYTAPELRRELFDVIRRGAKDVVVDLSRTTFIDSTTLGVLVDAARRLRPSGRVRLVCTDANILKVFQITALDRLFTIHPSLVEARGELDSLHADA